MPIRPHCKFKVKKINTEAAAPAAPIWPKAPWQGYSRPAGPQGPPRAPQESRREHRLTKYAGPWTSLLPPVGESYDTEDWAGKDASKRLASSLTARDEKKNKRTYLKAAKLGQCLGQLNEVVERLHCPVVVLQRAELLLGVLLHLRLLLLVRAATGAIPVRRGRG